MWRNVPQSVHPGGLGKDGQPQWWRGYALGLSAP